MLLDLIRHFKVPRFTTVLTAWALLGASLVSAGLTGILTAVVRRQSGLPVSFNFLFPFMFLAATGAVLLLGAGIVCVVRRLNRKVRP